MKKKRLLVSVSGGRTSMYMAIVLRMYFSNEYDMRFVFANTGCEHPDTLRFLHDAEVALDLPLVWLEACVHSGQRKASTHIIVDHRTASRDGAPFEDVVNKYGVPNSQTLHCTREMKLNPIKSYRNSIGWGDCLNAVGIRIDETRRVSKHATKDRIIYPLVDLFPADKDDVIDYMGQYDWDLRIPEHLGNCVACYKKSYKKLCKAYQDMPEAFAFTDYLETTYGRVGAVFKKNPTAPDNVFFRGRFSTKDMIKTFSTVEAFDAMPDIEFEGGCSESCEMYPTS